jgi:MFS family permease
MVTGAGPQSKVMIPPLATALTTAFDVQLAAVPWPTTLVGCEVSTARAAGGTKAWPPGFPALGRRRAAGLVTCPARPGPGRAAALAVTLDAASRTAAGAAATECTGREQPAASAAAAATPASRISRMGPHASAATRDHIVIFVLFASQPPQSRISHPIEPRRRLSWALPSIWIMASARQFSHESGAGMAVMSLCLVQFVDVLGVTVVVTALPSMLASLHAPESYGSLIATGYAMFFGGLLMLGARLGDRFGHRRTIVSSLVVFAAGAAIAATASSVVSLTAGRCLQGAAAAASVPSALRLLTTVTAEGPARRRAIAAWSAAGAAAGASGFVVGGVVTDLAGWRFVFWAYLPLAAMLVAAIVRSVPPDRDADPARSLNLAGAATFTAAVMMFVIGTTLVTAPAGRGSGGLLLAVCAVLAGVFIVIDRRAAEPLLPAQLLRSPPLREGALGGLLNTATTSSAVTLITLYLQNTLRRSPLEAAATLLPFSLAVIGGSSLSAVLLRRRRPQAVVALGLAVIAAADLALLPSAAIPWGVAACAAAAGTGIGLSSVAATSLGTDVEAHWRGTASGIINTAAQLGTAIGIAVLLLIAAATTGTPSAGTPAPRIAWAAASATAAAGALLFAAARRRRPAQMPAAR